MTQPKAAALYARISFDAEGHGAGVQRQLEDCRKLAESLGWPVAGEYVDNDVSAYSGKRRPEYERLLEDLREGMMDAVIVYHLDRLTRRPIELEEFLAVIDTARVRHVRFVTGHTDITTGDGLLVVRMLAAVAANESASKSRRIKRASDQRAAQGRPHKGSIRPFGYESDHVTVIESEAEIIRACVSRWLAGESLRSLATWLNNESVPTVSGVPWRTSTLRQVLNNPRYAGLLVHRGEVVGPGAWEAVISLEEHEKIKALTAERKNTGRRTPQRYLLSGLLRCERCGHRMYSNPKQGRRRYVCMSGPDFADGCGRLVIGAAPLEELIAEAVLYRLDSRELADAMTGRDSTDAATRELNTELAVTRERMDELAKAYGDGLIGMQDWLTAKRPIEDRIERVTRQLARLTKTTTLDGLVGNGESLRAAWGDLNLSRQHAIVKAVLDHAVIAPAERGQHTDRVMDRVRPIWRV